MSNTDTNLETIIVTIFSEDRPGIVRLLSKTIMEHDGNWLQSSLSRLCGQFTGIVHFNVPSTKRAEVVQALEGLKRKKGISVTVQKSGKAKPEEDEVNGIQILVEANDRRGIVQEITQALAKAEVNVDNIDTEVESASMAGYMLFRAHLFLAMPDDMSETDLEAILEGVSDDVMVSILEE